MRKDDAFKYFEPLMRGCSVLDTEVESLYSISLDRASYGRLGERYDIKKDKHIAEVFKPAYHDVETTRHSLHMIALCIASNLCLFSLGIPSPEQLRDLIAISPYSTEEWNYFVNSMSYETRSCFNGQKRLQIGTILFRTLLDHLYEDSKVLTQGQKKGRGHGGNAKGAQRYYQDCFQRIVKYLFDNDLLSLLALNGLHLYEDDPLFEVLSNIAEGGEAQLRGVEAYENAIKRYGELECRRHAISAEVVDLKKMRKYECDHLFIGMRDRVDKKFRDLRQEKKKLQSPLVLINQPKTAPFSPPAFPLPTLGNTDRLRLKEDPTYEILKEFYDEMDEKSARMKEYEKKIIDRARAEFSVIAEQEAAYLREDDATEIAESAFLAILNGDEMYNTGMGNYAFHFLIQSSCIPGASFYLPELEDEDDWDYIAFPGDNGKLENTVIRESDVAVFDFNEEDDLKVALKLGSAIAEFAECKVNLPIAIRKSQVKAFKKMGCSDRKARDCALVVASLRSATFSDSLEDDEIQYFPEIGDAHITVLPVEAGSGVACEAEQAKKELAEAQRQRKAAERESQQLRHELAKLRRELDQTQVQLGRSTSLLELYENREEDPQDEQSEGSAIQFPFTTSRKIVLYGGFHSFHQDISRLIPDIRIIPCASRIDVTPVRNADVVFIQINKTSHSGYWNVCDAARVSGVPYFHLNYAGPRRCAEEMVRIISDLDAKIVSPTNNC